MTSKSIQSRSASYRLLLAEVLQNDIGLEDASSELQDDRDVVLHCVRRCPKAIKHASARLRGDKEIILAAARKWSKALKFASAELQDDWDFVLRCVKLKPDPLPLNPEAIEYASSRLRGDKEIILAAASKWKGSGWGSATVLKFASTELQDDREVVLHCVKNGGNAIEHASARLRGDKEIILAAATAKGTTEYWKRNSATVLYLASAELQDDRDVVLHCVKNGGDAINHASARLRGDKEIILAAATGEYGTFNSDTVLNLASTELQDDRDVVLHCVKRHGYAIKHASARLRGDKEIILAAASKWNSATVLNLASAELQDDREVVLYCVKNCGDAIEHASARLRGDKEIILAATTEFWHSATVLNLASTELQDDRDVVLHCVKRRGDAVKHASARLRGDKEIILAAVKEWNSAKVLNLASTELQDDREVVLECVKNGGNAIEHASARLQDDREVVLECVKIRGDAIKHASARLRGDKEIILAAAKKWNSAKVLNLASTELQDDREVVLHCVKIRGDAIQHASARLRGDKKIILAAIEKRNGDTVLNLASTELQDDREVVLECVKSRGEAIQHASARLRGDKEMILAVATGEWGTDNGNTVLNLASTELQDDREVVLECVKSRGEAIKHASARLRGDKEMILAVATGEWGTYNGNTVLNLASTELQDDREVVLHCVKSRGDAIKHASPRLRGDKEMILAAANNWFVTKIVLECASTELQDDRDVVLHCVKIRGDAIKHASARLRGDKEIILAAANEWTSAEVLNLASTELQDDREVVLRIVELNPNAIEYASARLRSDKQIILAAEKARSRKRDRDASSS